MSQISQPNFVQLTERDFNRINGKKKKFLHPIKIYSSLTNLTEKRKNYRSEGVPEDAVSPPISSILLASPPKALYFYSIWRETWYYTSRKINSRNEYGICTFFNFLFIGKEKEALSICFSFALKCSVYPFFFGKKMLCLSYRHIQ